MILLEKIATIFDHINETVGKIASYLTAALMVLIGVVVLARYLFGVSEAWMDELGFYFFSLIFLLGAGYAFKHDKHVRVDVLYSKGSPKTQAWINLIGGLLFLLPWCVVVLQVAYRYALHAYLNNEGSAQPNGLPALYLLKATIFIGFFFLFLQGISSVLRSIITIAED